MNTEVIYVSGTGNTAALAKEIFQALPSSPKDIQELDRARNPLSADCYFIGFWANRGTASVEVLDFFIGAPRKKGSLFRHLRHGKFPGNTTRSWKTRSAPFSRTTMNTSAAFSAREKCPSGCVKNTKLCSAPSMTSWPAGSSKISMKRFFIPLLRISEKPLLLPKTSVKKWRQFYEG